MAPDCCCIVGSFAAALRAARTGPGGTFAALISQRSIFGFTMWL
jgi:hypothetical protein